MIGDKVIVDAVVHPYDLAQAEFVESPMDLAVIHSLLDPAEIVRRVALDEFSRARADRFGPSWSALRGTAPAPSA